MRALRRPSRCCLIRIIGKQVHWLMEDGQSWTCNFMRARQFMSFTAADVFMTEHPIMTEHGPVIDTASIVVRALTTPERRPSRLR